MIRDEVLTAEEVEGKSNTELLSKHILELQADKGRLTDMVKELEAQNERLCQSITDFQNREAGLESQIAELEQQIEKMRNCCNCKKNCEGYRNCTLQNLRYWEWDNGDIH